MSGAGSAASGSENWEACTNESETDEVDATEAYYAKVMAQQMRQQGHKRPASGMQLGATKTMREQQTIMEEGVPVEGSDAGWTDDGDIGDTY